MVPVSFNPPPITSEQLQRLFVAHPKVPSLSNTGDVIQRMKSVQKVLGHDWTIVKNEIVLLEHVVYLLGMEQVLSGILNSLEFFFEENPVTEFFGSTLMPPIEAEDGPVIQELEEKTGEVETYTVRGFAFFLKYFRRSLTERSPEDPPGVYTNFAVRMYTAEELAIIRGHEKDLDRSVRAMATHISKCMRSARLSHEMCGHFSRLSVTAQNVVAHFPEDGDARDFRLIAPLLWCVCKMQAVAITTFSDLRELTPQNKPPLDALHNRQIALLKEGRSSGYFRNQGRLFSMVHGQLVSIRDGLVKELASSDIQFAPMRSKRATNNLKSVTEVLEGFPDPQKFEDAQEVVILGERQTRNKRAMTSVSLPTLELDGLDAVLQFIGENDAGPSSAKSAKPKGKRKATRTISLPDKPTSSAAASEIKTSAPVKTAATLASEKLDRLHAASREHPLSLHPRVLRWRSPKVLDEMEAFQDAHKYHYKNRHENDKKAMVAFHAAGFALDPILFNPEVKDQYIHEANGEYGCIAEITANEKTYRGVILWKFNEEGECYHRMFESRVGRDWQEDMKNIFLSQQNQPLLPLDGFVFPKGKHVIHDARAAMSLDEMGTLTMEDTRCAVPLTIKIFSLTH